MGKNSLPSAFSEYGYQKTVQFIMKDIQELYLTMDAPWIIGYSGGKDSSTVLQLIWQSITELKQKEIKNPVHIIATDTLVENPVVAVWVDQNLRKMKIAAEEQGLPIHAHRLTPAIKDTFWVNLIGKGYPAPRPLFRWCTSRLKINPSNKFISNIAQKSGLAYLVLGMRKAESSVRASAMKKHEKRRNRNFLSPNANLPNTYLYTPIENWSNDDVWSFLLNNRITPWAFDNNELLTMYKGASPDNECPLVIESNTPSCGNSRFGCWVCTLVSRDSSMQAMIRNDNEKKWLLPMLEFRDSFDIKNDKKKRDFRRMTGVVQLFHDDVVPGPYTQKSREDLLRKLLETQLSVQQNKPSAIPDFELITLPQLREIRRIWVNEKHEFEDNLPLIYKEITGVAFPDGRFDDHLLIGADAVDLLRNICGDDTLHFELTRQLLDIERNLRMKARRAGLYEELEQAIRKNFYTDKNDAVNRARRKKRAKNEQIQLPIDMKKYINV